MLTFLRFNLLLALLGTFTAISLYPGSASAKLGEDLPALIKRFGSNYHPIPLGRWAEAAYKFETKTLTVDVFLVKGVSVSECYFSDHALVNGAPSQTIWRAIREKNAPNAKWIANGDNGFVSADNHYTTWFDTKGIPDHFTYAVGINDQIALRGDIPVPPLPNEMRVLAKEKSSTASAQPAGKPALPVVGGVAFDPTALKRYSLEYFRLAEAEGKQIYAAKNYTPQDYKIYDYPGHFVGLSEGEPLRVISVNPETLYLTVLRLHYNTTAIVSQEDVTIR